MVSKKRIAVTGYGSFGCYTTNPSSVIVDNLEKLEFSDGIELLTETIPVEYAAAERCSTRLCKDVKPDVRKLFLAIYFLISHFFIDFLVHRPHRS
jgi:pyrrolidone-carboxylate peptidase